MPITELIKGEKEDQDVMFIISEEFDPEELLKKILRLTMELYNTPEEYNSCIFKALNMRDWNWINLKYDKENFNKHPELSIFGRKIRLFKIKSFKYLDEWWINQRIPSPNFITRFNNITDGVYETIGKPE